MRGKTDNRQRLLYALVEHAQESGAFNPHLHRSEMMERLGLTEGEFNIAQKELGDRYCRYVDQHEGEARYEIMLSECLALRDRLEQQKTQQRRHAQLIRLAVLVAILGAVLGAALALWFQSR